MSRSLSIFIPLASPPSRPSRTAFSRSYGRARGTVGRGLSRRRAIGDGACLATVCLSLTGANWTEVASGSERIYDRGRPRPNLHIGEAMIAHGMTRPRIRSHIGALSLRRDTGNVSARAARYAVMPGSTSDPNRSAKTASSASDPTWHFCITLCRCIFMVRSVVPKA